MHGDFSLWLEELHLVLPFSFLLSFLRVEHDGACETRPFSPLVAFVAVKSSVDYLAKFLHERIPG
jgi:hypothetical protein